MAPRRNFGSTWWGKAWIESLEQRARLDANRLPRGRTYARQARVGTLHVEPGLVKALVQGNRPTPYQVQVRVRPFSDEEWKTTLDVIAAKAAHAAALLDGELPPEILQEAQSVEIELLPIAGEVGTNCSCPDWANPCKHAAAVCYLIADLMDDDPFTIFLLRGRARDAVLAGVRSRRSGSADPAASAAPGGRVDRAGLPGNAGLVARASRRDNPVAVAARNVWKSAGDSNDQASRLDAVERMPLAQHPGTPAPLALDPPPASGISRADLTALAADAARRAWAVLAGDQSSGLGLSRDHDVARRGSMALGTPAFDDVARLAAMPVRRLLAHAVAWQFGGAEGVDLTDSTWVPKAEQMAPAKNVLQEFGANPRLRDNRVSAGDFQLRLGRSGLWYRFERRNGAWELAAPPDLDPAELLLSE